MNEKMKQITYSINSGKLLNDLEEDGHEERHPKILGLEKTQHRVALLLLLSVVCSARVRQLRVHLLQVGRHIRLLADVLQSWKITPHLLLCATQMLAAYQTRETSQGTITAKQAYSKHMHLCAHVHEYTAYTARLMWFRVLMS